MNYFGSKKLMFSLFLTSEVIVGFALFLLNSPLEIILISTLIPLIFFLLYSFSDYKNYSKHYMALSTVKDIKFENLPEPKNSIDHKYTELLVTSLEKLELLSSDFSGLKDNLADFYGSWYNSINITISDLRTKLKEVGSIKNYATDLVNLETYSDLVLKYLLIDTIVTDEDLTDCNLKSIVRTLSRKHGQQILNSNFKVNVTNCTESIVANEIWLTFVIDQLLSNALKFTKEGYVTIFSEGDRVYVQDTGCGILENDLPNIFDNGFKGLNSDENSLGLGLFLCKKVLDKLGHSITIESTENVGTTVCVNFGKVKSF